MTIATDLGLNQPMEHLLRSWLSSAGLGPITSASLTDIERIYARTGAST